MQFMPPSSFFPTRGRDAFDQLGDVDGLPRLDALVGGDADQDGVGTVADAGGAAERVFFSAGFKSADQNNLKDHDFRLILAFYEDLIRQKTGKMPDEEIGFLLEMYCQSSVYMTVKWVTEGTKMPPERLAELMVKAMPEKISELFEQLEILY